MLLLYISELGGREGEGGITECNPGCGKTTEKNHLQMEVFIQILDRLHKAAQSLCRLILIMFSALAAS